MVVRVRFGQGPLVERRSGKNRGMARLASSVLTLVALGCASFGFWRVATDLDWAGDFVFRDGLLSHWQVWVGAAAAVQYGAWRLAGYARTSAVEETVISTVPAEITEQLKATADVHA